MNEDAVLGVFGGISEGNEEAFRQFYEMTHEKVFRYLYRFTNNRETAEDLLIETYTEVWKAAGSYRGASKVLTWVIGIARNLAMNEFRRSGNKDFEITEETVAVSASQHHSCAVSETGRIVAEALTRLPFKHREVLDLVFLQELRYEEIAVVVGIPVNTVKTRVFHAKDKLREVLKQMGVDRDDLV
jgi:RNA polymerase sigma-70 factor (ECF subfamily)